MYDPLAEYYEHIFPVSSSQIEFVRSNIGYGRSGADKHTPVRVLDVGCAVGDLASSLANNSSISEEIEVDAIDLNTTMVRRARDRHAQEKSVQAGRLRFHRINMLEIDKQFGQSSFGTVLCLGNTLVHLSGLEEIERFFQAAAHVLQENTSNSEPDEGSANIVIQILNYDYILETQPKQLPFIDTGQIRFEREYSFFSRSGYHNGGAKVVFTTRLLVKASGKIYEDSVELYPLKRQELETLLKSNGFTQPEFFGGFDGSLLKPDSFPLIAVAKLKH